MVRLRSVNNVIIGVETLAQSHILFKFGDHLLEVLMGLFIGHVFSLRETSDLAWECGSLTAARCQQRELIITILEGLL